MSCPFAQMYLSGRDIGLSFINTAAADTCVSCPFAQMYLSGRDTFKRSSFLYISINSSSSGTFTASIVNAVGGSFLFRLFTCTITTFVPIPKFKNS